MSPNVCPLCFTPRPCLCGRYWGVDPARDPHDLTPIEHKLRPGGPDLIQPIIGYRAWRIEGGEWLHSLGAGDMRWDSGKNTAVCAGFDRVTHHVPGTSIAPHAAPAKGCGCGLYALNSLVEALQGFSYDPSHPVVVGAIAAWGRIESHETGFRAEHARVMALGLIEYLCLTEKSYRSDVEAIARAYDVACVPMIDLPAEAAKHGIPMPDEMRPVRESVSGAEMAAAFARASGTFATGGFVASGGPSSVHPPMLISPPPPPPLPPYLLKPPSVYYPPQQAPSIRTRNYVSATAALLRGYMPLCLGVLLATGNVLTAVLIAVSFSVVFVKLQRRIGCFRHDNFPGWLKRQSTAHWHHTLRDRSAPPIEERCERCDMRVGAARLTVRAARAFASLGRQLQRPLRRALGRSPR